MVTPEQNITDHLPVFFFFVVVFCYWQCGEDLYLEVIFVKFLTDRILEEK